MSVGMALSDAQLLEVRKLFISQLPDSVVIHKMEVIPNTDPVDGESNGRGGVIGSTQPSSNSIYVDWEPLKCRFQFTTRAFTFGAVDAQVDERNQSTLSVQNIRKVDGVWEPVNITKSDRATVTTRDGLVYECEIVSVIYNSDSFTRKCLVVVM